MAGDVNAVKIEPSIQVEKASISPSLKFGGDKKTLNVSGNLVINQVFSGTVTDQNHDPLVMETQELLSDGKSRVSKIDLILSPFLGIVKTPKSNRTRLQLEFVFVNDNLSPKVIKGCYLAINKEKAYFRQFFTIDEKGIRSPNLSMRFPIIIASKTAERFNIEFENIDKKLIQKGNLKAELFVLVGESNLATKKFELGVNDAMVNTLNDLQIAANVNKSPILFDARIKS